MKQATRSRTVHETLQLVNRVRSAAGVPLLEELPPGGVRDPGDCPIQRGMAFLDADMLVWKNSIHIRRGRAADLVMKSWGVGSQPLNKGKSIRVRIQLPQPAGDFVQQFDLGQHPELVDLEISSEEIIAAFDWRTRARIQRAHRNRQPVSV